MNINRAGAALAVLALSATAATASAAKPRRADLAVKQIAVTPAQVQPGGDLSLSATVLNKGRRNAGSFEVSFALLPAAGGQKLKLGSAGVRAVRRGKSARGTASLTVPAVAKAGTYAVQACADARKGIRELRESNNCRTAGTVTVGAFGPGPGGNSAPGADRVAPAAPQLSSTDPASPGSSTSPTLKGRAEAGSTVRIYRTADCTGTPVAQGTTTGGGDFAVPVAVDSRSSNSFRATATDAAGNVSPCSAAISYVHEAPSITTGQAPHIAGFSPTSPSPVRTPTVKGFAGKSETLRIYATGDCTGPAVAETRTASFDGYWEAAVTMAANDTTVITARAFDAGGNGSPCSPPASYRHDAQAPAPVITSIAPAAGGSRRQPVLTGRSEPGSTVTAWVNNPACTEPWGTATAGGDGVFRIAAPYSLPTGVTEDFYVEAVDAAGNHSPFAVAGQCWHDHEAYTP